MELVGKVGFEQQGLPRALGDGQRPLRWIIAWVIKVVVCILALSSKRIGLKESSVEIIIRPSLVTASAAHGGHRSLLRAPSPQAALCCPVERCLSKHRRHKQSIPE